MKTTITMCAVVLLAAGAAWAGDYSETFDQSYALDHDGSVGLENINGDVTIEVWDRAEVRVYAIKRASSQERLDKLRIDVDVSGDRLAVDTDYPSSRDLGFADHHGHSEVEYTLTVPRSITIDEVELVNGDLVVDGVLGGVEADTVNGSVVVRNAAGELEIETVNGRIEAELGPDAVDEVSMSSVNGAIDVFISGSAEIRAETVNGSIRNDLGIEVHKGKYVGSSMRGSVGGGGPIIDLDTVNGAITVSSR
jgi:DUF4097 and DUF4098 domain-containing protein YvlB